MPFSVPVESRRRFLASASALAAAALATRIASAEEGTPPPPFPAHIPVEREDYLNWSGEQRVPGLWTASPRRPEDVEDLVNWAFERGWRVRAKGLSHTWSPLLMPSGRPLAPCLLVDLTRHLDAAWVGGASGAHTVSAQAGVVLDRLWDVVGGAGLGIACTPAPGHLTLGGAVAVGAHGSAVPVHGPVPGWTYGSLSNTVASLDAVVWDPKAGRYRHRTFLRGDREIGPLLVHAGRAFITAATLRVGEDVNLRCQSFTDIPVAELFASPFLAGARSLQAWVEATGRVEVTWWPFTDTPWLRVWSEAPVRPGTALALTEPYPFTFANWLSREASDDVGARLRASPGKARSFSTLSLAGVKTGLAVTGTSDVWGPSRFTTLHVRPSTMRYHVSGHVIHCRALDVQRVVSELAHAFSELLEAYAAKGLYPVNGPLDLRFSGLDHPEGGGREALLSPLRPGRPQWDTAVWVELMTMPGTPGWGRFFGELEAWMMGNYQGDYASVRMEWSKGWAYTPAGPWTGDTVLSGHVPGTYTSGYGPGMTWECAAEGLHDLDPHGVYGNAFLDRLFRSRR